MDSLRQQNTYGCSVLSPMQLLLFRVARLLLFSSILLFGVATFLPAPVHAQTLTAPQNFVVTPVDGGFSFSWSPVSGAQKYWIQFTTTSGSNYSIIDSTTNTSDTVTTGFNLNTQYYFVVAAVVGYNPGPNSTEVASKLSLAAPASLTGTVSSGQITLKWSAPANADGYYVSSEAADGSYSIVQKITPGSTTTWTGPVNSVAYQFEVQAYNNAGTGPGSTYGPGMVKPTAPQGLTVADNGGLPTFTWTAASNCDGYDFYYSSSTSGPFTDNLGPVTPPTLTLDINGRSDIGWNTIGYFTVTAYNAAGQSAQTNIVSAFCGAVAPSSVLLSQSGGNVVISWPAVPNSPGYYVNSATEQNGTYTYVTSMKTTSLSVPSNLPLTKDFFEVQNERGAASSFTNSMPAIGRLIVLGSPAIKIAPGGASAEQVSVLLTGSAVTAESLSVTGAPSGVVATFYPAAISVPAASDANALAGASTTLNLVVGSGVAAGTYPLTITATSGSTTTTAPLSLTVGS